MHDRTSIVDLVKRYGGPTIGKTVTLLIDMLWGAVIASGAMYFIPVEDNKKKVVAFGALFLVSWFAVSVAIRWGL